MAPCPRGSGLGARGSDSGLGRLSVIHDTAAVILVFGRMELGNRISCLAGSILICSYVKKSISSTTSELGRGVTRRSAGFLEVQPFEGMLILALILSLTSIPVGWNAYPIRIGGWTGRRGRFVWPTTREETVLTDAPMSARASALALAILIGIPIVGTDT